MAGDATVSGSGFFISDQGYVLTNNHVVEGTKEVKIILADGTEETATVVGTDRYSDIAVLKADGTVPAVAKLGDSSLLQPGETVIAIGSPLGDFKNTVTEGVFIAATIEGGKWRTISGIAGIAADTESGHGVLTLLQTFADDTSIKTFQKRDRLYSVVIVEDAPGGIVCRRSQWEKLFALKGEPKLVTVPCEFTVGNTVAPAGSQ